MTKVRYFREGSPDVWFVKSFKNCPVIPRIDDIICYDDGSELYEKIVKFVEYSYTNECETDEDELVLVDVYLFDKDFVLDDFIGYINELYEGN